VNISRGKVVDEAARGMDVNTPVDNFDPVIASHCNEANIEKMTAEKP
jgi:hypothetical protein